MKPVPTLNAMPLQQITVSPQDRFKDGRSDQEEWKIKGQEPVYTATNTNSAPLERCTSQASTLSNSFDICRICHCEGERDAPLIAPCYCAGSLRYVHQACLQQWIKSSDIRCCELCKFQFIMYSKIKPITQWEQLELSALERRRLICSVMFHTMALTCVLWSLYVLIDRTLEEIDRGVLEWPLWTKLSVVTLGVTGGAAFIYIQGKTYCQLCRRWRAFNRVIYVQNAPEKAALEPPSLEPAPQLEGTSSLLSGGGCCGVQTESSVIDIQENPHEQNTSVDMHQGPASSSSNVAKLEICTCKEDMLDKEGWCQCPSTFGTKDDQHVNLKCECNDTLSISSFEINGKEYNSKEDSVEIDMEPLPPPPAFVDSATNTEVKYENEKEETKEEKTSSYCSLGGNANSPPASCSTSGAGVNNWSDHKLNNSFLIANSLAYGHPARVGYPYMLSTFHPMIPPRLPLQQREERLRGCSSSSSDECVESSSMKFLPSQLKQLHVENVAVHQPARPWTVGGSYFLQSTPSETWNQQVEDIRTEKSGVRSAVPDASSRPNCPESPSSVIPSNTCPN